MKCRLSLLIAVCCTFCVVPATATIIFSDDFSGDSSGIGQGTLLKWNVLNGTDVDVGSFGALCGPGPAQCIDTQGSGAFPNGDIQTKSTFAVGPGFNYNFHFTLNNSSGTNSFLLTIGSFSQLISTATSNDGAYDLPFTLATNPNATIRITDQGPNDRVGIYLGHIQFSSTAITAGAPEPATFGISAFAGGILFLLRRKAAKHFRGLK